MANIKRKPSQDQSTPTEDRDYYAVGHEAALPAVTSHSTAILNGAWRVVYKILGEKRMHRTPASKLRWLDGRPKEFVNAELEAWKTRTLERYTTDKGKKSEFPIFDAYCTKILDYWLMTADIATIDAYVSLLKSHVFLYFWEKRQLGRQIWAKHGKSATKDIMALWLDTTTEQEFLVWLRERVEKPSTRQRIVTAYNRFKDALMFLGVVPRSDHQTKADPVKREKTKLPGELPGWNDLADLLDHVDQKRLELIEQAKNSKLTDKKRDTIKKEISQISYALYLLIIECGFGVRISEAAASSGLRLLSEEEIERIAGNETHSLHVIVKKYHPGAILEVEEAEKRTPTNEEVRRAKARQNKHDTAPKGGKAYHAVMPREALRIGRHLEAALERGDDKRPDLGTTRGGLIVRAGTLMKKLQTRWTLRGTPYVYEDFKNHDMRRVHVTLLMLAWERNAGLVALVHAHEDVSTCMGYLQDHIDHMANKERTVTRAKKFAFRT